MGRLRLEPPLRTRLRLDREKGTRTGDSDRGLGQGTRTRPWAVDSDKGLGQGTRTRDSDKGLGQGTESQGSRRDSGMCPGFPPSRPRLKRLRVGRGGQVGEFRVGQVPAAMQYNRRCPPRKPAAAFKFRAAASSQSESEPPCLVPLAGSPPRCPPRPLSESQGSPALCERGGSWGEIPAATGTERLRPAFLTSRAWYRCLTRIFDQYV